MKVCKFCGAESPDYAAFCPSCGSNEFRYRCGNCRTVFEGGNFCPRCGIKFGTVPKRCPNCGTTYFSPACPNCGFCGYKNNTVNNNVYYVNTPPVQPVTAAAQPVKKKRKTWLWVLGWIFMFPVPLTILIARSKSLNKGLKIALIAAIWIFFLILGNTGDSSNSTSTKKDVSQPVATEKTAVVKQRVEKTQVPTVEQKIESTQLIITPTEEIKPEDSVPSEYKNALRKAETYSSFMNMSRQGIFDQLTSEYGDKFSADAAQYAVDNLDADFKANALEKAKIYQQTMSMSKSAIYDQLTSSYGEKFTAEEAQYAVDHLDQGSSTQGAGANQGDNVSAEFKSALRKAETYSDTMHMSKQGIYDQLTSEYGEQFPADAAQYAVDHLNADFKENALEKAKFYQEMMSMSNAAIYNQLTSSYGEKFTAEEAQYAIDHLQ